jgi:hypothetical protein
MGTHVGPDLLNPVVVVVGWEGFGVPRLPGGPAKNLPPCPKPGHAARRVVKDGSYGKPPRQRFRCIGEVSNQKTGEVRQFHRFTPSPPRLLAESAVCDTCDNEVRPHTGPVSSRSYAFPVREVASAFVSVGTGASYMQAAGRARVSARRQPVRRDQGGALVAEWLDLLAPVVLEAHAEKCWPETLVLDSTWFMAENPWTHTRSLAFNVLGAYGYPDGAAPGRLWALHATHTARQPDWERFLRSLDISTPPKLVISDGNAAIINAVRAVWPATPGPSFPTPFIARCELHLHRNGVEHMAEDNIGGWMHPMRQRLGTAFLRSEGWDELVEKVDGYLHTEAWLTDLAEVETQVAVRHLLPAHHSTAALDQALGRVRDSLSPRTFVLRNKRRTNLTLGLIRLHLMGVDIERDYGTRLREHLDARGGVLPAQRSGKDTGAGPKTDRRYRVPASLRA